MQDVDSRDCYDSQMPHQTTDLVQTNPFQPIDPYHVQPKAQGHPIQTTNCILQEPTQRPTVIETNQPHIIECTWVIKYSGDSGPVIDFPMNFTL